MNEVRRPDSHTARQRHAEKVIDMRVWLQRRPLRSRPKTSRADIRQAYIEDVRRGTGCRVLLP